MKHLILILLLPALSLAACPTPDQPQERTSMPQGFPKGQKGPNATMTADQCKAAGGSVVGDIGNGAIFKPDYTCESNGKAPLARIASEEGKPIATEGAVCCGPSVEE